MIPVRARARAILAHRLGGLRRDDAGAALLTVLLIILVLAALSVLVLGTIISQVRPTAFTQQSSRSLFAAEAGVQAALGQIRTATTGTSTQLYGDTTKLPCVVSGTVGDAGAARYDVSVTYFALDPSGQSPAWQSANQIACSTGTSLVPAFALVKAVGTSASGPGATPERRTLESKYTFRLTNPNVAGGLVWTPRQLACLEVGDVKIGAAVRYAGASRCSTRNGGQRWIYDTDYAIKLAVTVGSEPASPDGALCLTGASGQVRLQKCAGTYDQLWSWEQFATFRGQKSDNTGYGDQCLYAASRSDTQLDDQMLLAGKSGCDQVNTDWKGFSPTPGVGAGGAGVQTQQLVNYLQFGRCFDIPNADWDAKDYIFISPCKQNPSIGRQPVPWNQRIAYTKAITPAGQRTRMVVTNDIAKGSPQRCLTVPAPGKAPAFVVMKPCTGSAENPAASQEYTRFDDTGTYASGYLFTTADGRCLSVGPLRTNNNFERSTIVAAPCTGGPEQKWNAPPDLGRAELTGTREVPRSGP